MVKFMLPESLDKMKPRVFRLSDSLFKRLSKLKKRSGQKNYNDLFALMIQLSEDQFKKEIKQERGKIGK